MCVCTQVTLSLVSSELSGTDTSVFSVNVSNETRRGNIVEVTLLITLLPSQEELSREQISKIRDTLINELQQAPTIITTETLIRVGKLVHLLVSIPIPVMHHTFGYSSSSQFIHFV